MPLLLAVTAKEIIKPAKTDAEAVHCLVLTLTIFGNLVQHGLISFQIGQEFLQTIIKVLAISKYKDSEFYLALKNCANTKDLFQKVIQPLLNSIDLKLMLLQTGTHLGKVNIRIKSLLSSQIPMVPFRQTAKRTHTDQIKTLGASVKNGSAKKDQDQKDQSNELSSSPEAEDEEIQEEIQAELNSMEKIKYEPEPELIVDSELEKEKAMFQHNGRCIICNKPVENNEQHFKEKKHKDQKILYAKWQGALSEYTRMQAELQKMIDTCRKVEHGSYELEKFALEAEDFIRENKEEIAHISQGYKWEEGHGQVCELMEKTKKVLADLNNNRQLTLHSDMEQLKAATTSDEEKSEEDEEISIELSKTKLTRKKQSKKGRK